MKQTILAIAIAISFTFALPLGAAESNDDVPARFSYEEGVDNIPPGCTPFHVWADGNSPDGSSGAGFIDNPCHQIATDMNGLDSPKIDVLILAPASPTAERDMRIMRQSIEMWSDGIDWMAADMGLDWLADGVEFHVSMDTIDTNDDGESEFTTYPIVDPEIVVIASNPAGGIGIGIDPSDFIFGNFFGDEDMGGPCHGVANPFDMGAWEALPGFDSHHEGRSGTYVEDCDGAGGNVCFAVNGAIDPLAADPLWTENVLDFQLFDLVSHEVGHCLTIGHVGDGAEGAWSSVPTNDIMAYHSDPPGISKCVSSLDVEGFVISMSRYLDTNGDGVVDAMDKIYGNDAEGEGDGTGRPFMIQHPDNHYYASPTRDAMDCPQPDFSEVPLSETLNFTPDAPERDYLAFRGVLDDDVVPQGYVALNGHTHGGFQSGHTLMLNMSGHDNVTIPVDGAGDWTASIDLSGVPDLNATVVSAIWLDADGQVVDSDRVRLMVDATQEMDLDSVRNAVAGPGSIASGDPVFVPGVGSAFMVLGLVGAALVARRRL